MQSQRKNRLSNDRRARIAVAIGILAGFAFLIGLFLAMGKPFEPAYLALLGGVGSMLVVLVAAPAKAGCSDRDQAEA